MFQNEVSAHNAALAIDVAESKERFETLEKQVQQRKDKFREIQKHLCPSSVNDLYHLIPSDWLRSWISGVEYTAPSATSVKPNENGVCDLTCDDTASAPVDCEDSMCIDLIGEVAAEQPDKKMYTHTSIEEKEADAPNKEDTPIYPIHGVLFSDPISNVFGRCKHNKGIDPTLLHRYKAVSDDAFAILCADIIEWRCHSDAAALPIDWDVNRNNAICPQCAKEAAETASSQLDVINTLKVALTAVMEDEPDMRYCIEKKWLTALRKKQEAAITMSGREWRRLAPAGKGV